MANDSNNSYCFFFVFVVITCLIALLAFFSCHKSHIDSLERILACQDRQNAVMDSSFMNFHNKMNDIAIQKSDAIKKVISDPILEKLPMLTSEESANIRKSVETAIIASTTDYLYSDAINEYESLVLSNRWVQLQSDTKSLLELEMSKIQNEYETLGVWAGILTVVFLIFSFYSLFKTDDLVKQGQEGLDSLNRLKRSADDKLDQMKLKGDEKLDRFDEKCKDVLKKAEDDVLKKLDNIDLHVRSRDKIWKDNMKRNIEDVNKMFENERKTMTEKYEQADFAAQVIDNKRHELSLEFDKMEVRLSLLEQKIASVNMKLAETTKED